MELATFLMLGSTVSFFFLYTSSPLISSLGFKALFIVIKLLILLSNSRSSFSIRFKNCRIYLRKDDNPSFCSLVEISAVKLGFEKFSLTCVMFSRIFFVFYLGKFIYRKLPPRLGGGRRSHFNAGFNWFELSVFFLDQLQYQGKGTQFDKYLHLVGFIRVARILARYEKQKTRSRFELRSLYTFSSTITVTAPSVNTLITVKMLNTFLQLLNFLVL